MELQGQSWSQNTALKPCCVRAILSPMETVYHITGALMGQTLKTIQEWIRASNQLGLEVVKLFSCSTQLSMKFILLINVKMPTIIDILKFISKINDWF